MRVSNCFEIELFPPSIEELEAIIKEIKYRLSSELYREEWKCLNEELIYREEQINRLKENGNDGV